MIHVRCIDCKAENWNSCFRTRLALLPTDHKFSLEVGIASPRITLISSMVNLRVILMLKLKWMNMKVGIKSLDYFRSWALDKVTCLVCEWMWMFFSHKWTSFCLYDNFLVIMKDFLASLRSFLVLNAFFFLLLYQFTNVIVKGL
jgi:hypothetical protein